MDWCEGVSFRWRETLLPAFELIDAAAQSLLCVV